MNPHLKLQGFHPHQWIQDPEPPPVELFHVSSLTLHPSNVPTSPVSTNSGGFCLTSCYLKNKIGPAFQSSNPFFFFSWIIAVLLSMNSFILSRIRRIWILRFWLFVLHPHGVRIPFAWYSTSTHSRKMGKKVRKNCSRHGLALTKTECQNVKDMVGWSISLLPPLSTAATNHLGTSETPVEKWVLLISMRLWLLCDIKQLSFPELRYVFLPSQVMGTKWWFFTSQEHS